MKFGNVKNKLLSNYTVVKHWGKKNAPTILTVAGLILNAGAAVWACYKTLKLEMIVADRDRELDILDGKKEELGEKKYNRSLYKTYISFFGRVGFNYAGPLALGALGTIAIIGGHGMLLTSVGSLTSLLMEANQRNADLEEFIRDRYGDETLVKLKMGEPIGQIGVSNESENYLADIYDDPDGFDFVWGPTMKGFSTTDMVINQQVIRNGNQMFGRVQQTYGDNARINDIYRYFGAYEKIDSMYDYEEVGFPNYMIADYPGEGKPLYEAIPLDEHGNKCETEPWTHKCSGYLIHFPYPPIPCRELSMDAGFRKRQAIQSVVGQ